MSNNIGVISMGIKTPIIREGDDLSRIVVDSVIKATKAYDGIGYFYNTINDGDVIGITESIVARAAGLYVTVDDIANDIVKKFGVFPNVIVENPIYSRNRFSVILRGIARAASKIYFVMPPYDEVGNPSGVNQFTGVDIQKYYAEICHEEECEAVFGASLWVATKEISDMDIEHHPYIYCGLHDYKSWRADHPDSNHITLADICQNFNPDYGLLGSNKATDEKLKLFPTKKIAQELVEKVQAMMYKETNKYVEVMVYGDGCFKDPVGCIWEFADPDTTPGFTQKLNGRPNEIKIKAFADDEFKDLNGEELTNAIKEKIRNKEVSLVGNMASQGTTPRRFVDLLASLMDLTSGSGDKGTPIVLVKNYFKNYSN